MTNEEAINTIKVAIGEVEWNYPLDYTMALEFAISAIKKQIPKKPKIRKAVFRKDTKMHTCRCCGAGIILTDRYCCNCGQAIDRSDM